MTATEVQLQLPVFAPRRYHLTATEVHLGRVWLPLCREALAKATATEDQSS